MPAGKSKSLLRSLAGPALIIKIEGNVFAPRSIMNEVFLLAYSNEFSALSLGNIEEIACYMRAVMASACWK
jgi:hypothetical protein